MKIVLGLVALVLVGAAALWMANDTLDQIQIGSASVSAPDGVYDPVRSGEQTPDGFSQLLPRDAILPVYSPTFRSVAATDWRGDTLVIGVEHDGEAKAYPVSFLNHREMVNDWIGGSPVLVTW